MKWAIIGCGVIGERRGKNLPEGVSLCAVFDPDFKKATALAETLKTVAAKSLQEVFEKYQPNAVIIAAINSVLVPTAQAALDHNCHILVEKPAARSAAELRSLKNPKNKIIKVGFNHRFHPAYEELLSEIENRKDDPIMFIRAQYGNGARLGFEKEWRAKVELSGGGEMLDQGVHVLDLASVLIPDLKVVAAYTKTHFWDMEVDDNAWAILSGPKGATFTFHVSSSEWKNEFRFEVYTRQRKYQWLGLGRSYGEEKLIVHTMTPEMGPPKTEQKTYPGEDQSWLKENTNFRDSILGTKTAWGNHADAVNCLSLVEKIYESSKKLSPTEHQHPKWWT